MYRRLLGLVYPILCFLSFVLCLATTALWARSTQTLDRLRSGSATRRVTLHVKDGEVYLDVATASRPVWAPGFQRIHASPAQFRPPAARWSFAGFEGGTESAAPPVYGGSVVVGRRFVALPLWIVVVVSLVMPVLWYDARGRSRAEGARAPDAAARPGRSA